MISSVIHELEIKSLCFKLIFRNVISFKFTSKHKSLKEKLVGYCFPTLLPWKYRWVGTRGQWIITGCGLNPVCHFFLCSWQVKHAWPILNGWESQKIRCMGIVESSSSWVQIKFHCNTAMVIPIYCVWPLLIYVGAGSRNHWPTQ